jgi:hypothetical protein
MRCLVIMPFRPDFDEVFATIRQAATKITAGETLTARG